MNNDYFRAIKDIASEYSGILTSSGVFSGEEAASISRGITDEVMPLLNFDKPKVLVYGIYNSGKSTLVNAICGREVAEPANRPMTYKIDEYDAGKFILIDSPGIDAPIDHEVIADKQIKSCHVILFVISSKGGFEQEKNYAKMLELIQLDLPFIIVLNDRAVPDDEMKQHLIDINNMKLKIIENLKKECRIQGINSTGIEDRYDVISLNAKAAWIAVSKANDKEKKDKLLAASHISDLTNRISERLEGKKAMENLRAPLSALERKIGEGREILTSKTAGEDYAMKRETLQQKISQFTDSFQNDVRYAVEKHFDEIYQGFLGNAPIDMARLYNVICQEAEDLYKRQSLPLIGYIRTNFSALGVRIDDSGHVTLKAPESPALFKQHDAEEESPKFSTGDDGSIFDDISAENISKAAAAGAAAGAALGSFVPVIGTAVGTAAGGVLGGAAELVRELFESSAKRERMEYERRKREVDAFNEQEARRVEAENRRRQDARVAASNQVNSIVRDLRTSYSDEISRNFNGVMQIVDNAITRISTGNARIQSTIGKLNELLSRIQNLRIQIIC